MQWLSKLFKSNHYTSGLDDFLAELRRHHLIKTPGRVAKERYANALHRVRDGVSADPVSNDI